MLTPISFSSITRARSIALALALALGWSMLRAPRAQAAGMVVEGEIRALAIAGDRVVALRAGEAVVLTTAGQVLGVLGRSRGADVAPTQRRRPSAEEVVDLSGVADDDLESDQVADALDDEGVAGRGGRRHRAPADGVRAGEARPANGAAAAPPLLAAGRHSIWIAGGAGLLHLDADPATATLPVLGVPVGSRHLALSALAAAPEGDALAALAGHHVLRSSDGGVSWRLLAILTARPRAVEIAADGQEVYVLDDDGVAIVAHRQRLAIFEGRAYHLARCGDDLLILGDDGIYAWRWDRGLEKRSGRLPARRLVCSAAVPGLTIAFGGEVLVSTDGGGTWNHRADLSTGDIESLAIAPDRLWVGTPHGLLAAPLAAGPQTLPARREPPRGAAAATTPAPPSRVGSWAGSNPWQDFAPRVSLVLNASTTRPGGDRGALWLLLTFPLERRRAHAGEAARLAADLLRRRATLSAELIRLSRAPAGPKEQSDAEDHAVAAEEAAALAQVVRDGLAGEPP